MPRRTWTLLGLGVAAIGLTAVATADSQSGPDAHDLTSEVKSLRKQVEALEKRLSALENGAPRVLFSPSQVPADAQRYLDPRQLPNDLPSGAERREFNGLSYYVMPIGNGEAAATGAPVTLAAPVAENSR